MWRPHGSVLLSLFWVMLCPHFHCPRYGSGGSGGFIVDFVLPSLHNGSPMDSPKSPKKSVGVLDLQGDVIEHCRALEACGAIAVRVKTMKDLDRVQGLIIPGGESTTIGKLMQWTGLDEAIRARIVMGMPVYGTCAGSILLAQRLEGQQQAASLGVMDVAIERNAYGRQLDSFEAHVEIEKQDVPAVFIRAPRITSIGPAVSVLGRYKNDVVMAREGLCLISTFHPELTSDLTVHRYFLKMVPHPSSICA